MMWNGDPASRPRESKPEEYWYTDIDEYFYNSDKIMMKNKVVFDIRLLRHLPRAVEYANHRHDPVYQANLIKQEELENKRPEGTSRYTDEVVARNPERYNINGRIVSKEEFERHMLEQLKEPMINHEIVQKLTGEVEVTWGGKPLEAESITVDYNLDAEEKDVDGRHVETTGWGRLKDFAENYGVTIDQLRDWNEGVSMPTLEKQFEEGRPLAIRTEKNATIKAKPSKPKTPLKNRMKQLGR